MNSQLETADLQRLAQAHRWIDASTTFHALCQAYVDRHDVDGLVKVMRSQLESVCPVDAVAAVDSCFAAVTEFEAELRVAFKAAVNRAAGRSDVAAIYCEYFYDGGDCSSIDVFLCQSFTRSNDHWASEFLQSDRVNGPNIQALLNYDRELQLDPCADFIASSYAYTLLLRVFAHAVNSCKENALPVGFAEHDGLIIYF